MNKTIGNYCSSRNNSGGINTAFVSNNTTSAANTTINDDATLNITVSINNTAEENETALSTCAFNQSETDVDMNQVNAYVAILRISPLKKEDEQFVHILTITNELGTTSYAVRIPNIEGKFEMLLPNN